MVDVKYPVVPSVAVRAMGERQRRRVAVAAAALDAAADDDAALRADLARFEFGADCSGGASSTCSSSASALLLSSSASSSSASSASSLRRLLPRSRRAAISFAFCSSSSSGVASFSLSLCMTMSSGSNSNGRTSTSVQSTFEGSRAARRFQKATELQSSSFTIPSRGALLRNVTRVRLVDADVDDATKSRGGTNVLPFRSSSMMSSAHLRTQQGHKHSWHVEQNENK